MTAPAGNDPDAGPVIVVAAATLAEADFICVALKVAGVYAVVSRELTTQWFPHLSRAINPGGIEVLVSVRDVPAARKALDQLLPPSSEPHGPAADQREGDAPGETKGAPKTSSPRITTLRRPSERSCCAPTFRRWWCWSSTTWPAPPRLPEIGRRPIRPGTTSCADGSLWPAG
ncbi:hypothetical protein LCGC14_1258080 [marine sediment metagenome]|uniref:DUF2007 domain-containing protein n=1 Tax=marine sediment metagenome TaxID=412755 RepID=A0A0F9NI68_9ZZZZ